ncbi:MAG TPA: hypothetical protein VGQ04_21615 [Chitinophagaceae bacterium]|jgi:predicted lipid-binding transport protein (Tim44 family)|nr:hypothetical protein [Chitinophagaceae bacterium]
MKLFWTSIKISIAGAKLSHLVQKDKIWDHGSMAEQARIIFYLVQKALINGNIDMIEKYMTASCFEKLQREMNQTGDVNKVFGIKEPVIKELAVIEVYPAKNNKSDRFTAIIKVDTKIKNEMVDNDHLKQFSVRWSFIRQGDWWLLDRIEWHF